MTLTIREAEPSDLPALAGFLRSLAAHHGDTAQVTETQLARLLIGRRRAARAIVAVVNGHPVGFAATTERVRLTEGNRGTVVEMLFVRVEHRGQGIGRALVDAAAMRAEAEGHAFVVIGTDPRNRDAQAAYRAMGMEDMSDTPGPRFFRRLGTAA